MTAAASASASRSLFMAALEATMHESASSPPAVIMDGFHRLPPELLPVILGHLRFRQNELARASLVCREWAAAAKPLIWEWVRTRDSDRIEKAFHILSQNKDLCWHVRTLEVRVYPLSALSKLEALSQEVLSTLKHLKNLRSLVWTRKGSLSAEMFEAICQLDKLERLELNATPAGGWRADQVVRLPLSLQSLTLLLPDREVVAYHLPRWLAKRHERKQAIADDRSSSHVDAPLRQLSIICMESPIVNTTTLAEIGRPGLAGLTSFTLHGCIRLSDVDVLDFLKRTPQLRHLALEAVSISPGFYSEAAPYLSRLESLRTSHPGRKSQATDAYYAGLLALVTAAQGTLRSFTHYLSGDTERGRHPEVPHAFLAHLVQSCKETLVKLEISGLSMQPISVRDICLTAKKLEHLVLPVDMRDLDEFQFSLLGLTELQYLHLVAPSTQAMYCPLPVMLGIVKHCSSTLRQIGVQNRVRSIGRQVYKPDRSTVFYEVAEMENDPTAPWYLKNGMRVSLDPWNEPLGIWPEALLVVRT